VTCENIRSLVHAYLDSELDLARSLEIEDHLRGCESCAREVADVRMLRTGIANGAVYHQAPPALEERVRSLLASQPHRRGERDTKLPRLGWTLIGAAAAVAFVAILLKDVLPLPVAPVANTTHEVVADHVRSLMANHLTDVASSNQHTVKPWFDGRLDFAPAVTDFKDQGFSLIGGRLDYVENHPVAAIVYKRREHVINLFVWPMLHMEDSRPVAETRDGFSVVHWTQGAMAYWAVSSVNTSELEKFADLVREAGSSPLPARQ
jgi:anti-sigma factor RsiW